MITFSKDTHGGINVYLNGNWVAWTHNMKSAKIVSKNYR
jgi:hypothetical protein